MKKVLLSAIITVSSLSFSLAHNYNGNDITITPKDNSDKIIIISKTSNEESNKIEAGKARVLVQEIENDELGQELTSNTKEVEVASTKFNDDNFKYVKEKRDLVGYALQLASFSDLALAKEYALKIAQKGDAEKRQLFIYTVNNPDRTFYKVYFGLLKTDDSAREKQRTFLSLGYSPFVKEFK
ncbi:MAG: SPOR domain-containing protein [Emticicia sp.]|uniref:SPOR domain-containing protein n=1 Tax=Emticicia sp. TaxID=1930953 RepID=UPI003BA5D529